MPSVHKHPAKTFRPEPELYARAQAAVSEVGSDMQAHIVGFLRWLTHETDSLPSRPPKPQG
ncbi:hypothetical protein [Actinacidiphila epipremni]|uniref:Uncharacterized protein n=1 Tax=Actinacidiphila epipremni TaxID=2053013 RepID=A0ABX0ZHL5_9ACTN|nr:hypothetical protein [Actinacidiphila epipremni]NJP42292.1 hypothetical protein [Actinacidiphila epipremni]